MRPGEAIAMTAAEIDRSDPTCWLYRPGHHKTEHKDKTRVIFIGARAQEIILPYLVKTTDGPLFPIGRAALRRAIHRGCEKLYPHPTIKRPTQRELKKMDAQTKKVLLAELNAWDRAHQWHPSQLRHTAATEFRSKFGLEAAQVLLGHSKADTTQVYAERDLKKAADVARQVG
jgi:integrase